MKKFLTLMVIPHNQSHVREFHLSRPILWGVTGTMGLVLCTLIFFAVTYYGTRHREMAIQRQQTENEELKRQFAQMNEHLDNVRHHIDQLTEKDRMMRAWVDLSEPGDEVRQMGVGGGTDEPAEWEGLVNYEMGGILTETYTNLDQLLREARFLQTSYDTIVSRLSQGDSMRQHLPSIHPVKGPSWRSSPFGYRQDPFTGRRQFHNGVDLAGWPGTPIVATADGIVEKASYDRRLGYFVSIDHGYGYRTIYGHMRKKSLLAKGARVKRGEGVGEMGKSGRATATHVHYSVQKNGRAEDPLLYIFEEKNRLAQF